MSGRATSALPSLVGSEGRIETSGSIPAVAELRETAHAAHPTFSPSSSYGKRSEAERDHGIHA
jgi:hypothetical protein